jgi:hypothetical protein
LSQPVRSVTILPAGRTLNRLFAIIHLATPQTALWERDDKAARKMLAILDNLRLTLQQEYRRWIWSGTLAFPA